MRLLASSFLSAVLAFATTSALADDWTVTRLRGGVFVLSEGQWEQLQRGSVVSDDRVIKSADNSRATFVRGLETVELGPETTAQISDGSGYTTVYNHAGTVGVDAEARNVEHFAVQTRQLAAVVKGTAFVVRAGGSASTVAVTRGQVDVSSDQADGRPVSITAGEEITLAAGRPLTAQAIQPITLQMPPPPRPVSASAMTAIGNSNGANPPSDTGRSDTGNGNGNAGGNGNGNAGGNGNGNAGGNGNGDAGGNGNGNAGGNGNGNAGGNGNGNAGGNGNGNGNGKK